MNNLLTNIFLNILFVFWTTGSTDSSSPRITNDKNGVIIGTNKAALDYRPAGMIDFKNHKDIIENRNGTRKSSTRSQMKNSWKTKQMNKQLNYKKSILQRKSCGINLAKTTTDTCQIVDRLRYINDLLKKRKKYQEKLDNTKLFRKNSNSSSEVLYFLEYITKKIEEGNIKLKENIKIKNSEMKKKTNLKNLKINKNINNTIIISTTLSSVNLTTLKPVNITSEKKNQITIDIDVDNTTEIIFNPDKTKN
ncbi:hypothetical protein HCN44_002372 [Aphidius gifuensis]|uniref:Odorant-binding protein n=1 Tax=Aphidius gifuensis TaxID=684658 RepID=A0A834Y2D3_APHGI|nr:uncharacterized protein LOC122860767 [Aphidius gifuensis]KAF7996726.1 hypothetical protein HCN44_002372 [Aphidius gifuensis]